MKEKFYGALSALESRDMELHRVRVLVEDICPFFWRCATQQLMMMINNSKSAVKQHMKFAIRHTITVFCCRATYQIKMSFIIQKIAVEGRHNSNTSWTIGKTCLKCTLSIMSLNHTHIHTHSHSHTHTHTHTHTPVSYTHLTLPTRLSV